MEAVILAAGRGTRLRQLTRETSKCLLDVGGMTIYERMVDHIFAAGIQRIHVVVGHAAQEVMATVRDRRVHYIFNPHYATSNVIVSTALALPFVEGDFFTTPCDVVFDPPVLTAFLSRREGIVMAVDRSRPYDEAASRVTIRGGRVVRTGKHIPEAETDGETTGMYAYYGEAAERFRESVFGHIDAGRRQMFKCEVIDSLICENKATVYVADITGQRWCEVDNEQDLLRARAMFGGYAAAANAGPTTG